MDKEFSDFMDDLMNKAGGKARKPESPSALLVRQLLALAEAMAAYAALLPPPAGARPRSKRRRAGARA